MNQRRVKKNKTQKPESETSCYITSAECNNKLHCSSLRLVTRLVELSVGLLSASSLGLPTPQAYILTAAALTRLD